MSGQWWTFYLSQVRLHFCCCCSCWCWNLFSQIYHHLPLPHSFSKPACLRGKGNAFTLDPFGIWTKAHFLFFRLPIYGFSLKMRTCLLCTLSHPPFPAGFIKCWFEVGTHSSDTKVLLCSRNHQKVVHYRLLHSLHICLLPMCKKGFHSFFLNISVCLIKRNSEAKPCQENLSSFGSNLASGYIL